MTDALTMLGGLAVIAAMIGIGLAAARALGAPAGVQPIGDSSAEPCPPRGGSGVPRLQDEPGDIERRARRMQ